MEQFIVDNWMSLVIIAGLLVYIVYLVINRKWDQLRAVGYQLILEAENLITGTKMGKERFEFVIGRLYSLIPVWLQLFIPEELLRIKLQEWYDSIKDYMDNGKVDNSV